MENIISVLEKSGLSRTEAQVYIALIRRGTSTAYRVSKEAGLYKANTYMAIETLVRKGLVISSVQNRKQLLTAMPPEEFVHKMDEQKERLQSIIPLLERNFDEEYSDVSVFSGVADFFQVFSRLLDQQDSIFVFDIPGYVPDLVKDHIMKFHTQRIKQRIKMYHIYDYDAADRIKLLSQMPLTYAKQGDSHRKSVVSTFVCGNTTLIVNWKNKVRTVRIVDKDTAAAYRHQFEILWGKKIK